MRLLAMHTLGAAPAMPPGKGAKGFSFHGRCDYHGAHSIKVLRVANELPQFRFFDQGEFSRRNGKPIGLRLLAGIAYDGAGLRSCGTHQ